MEGADVFLTLFKLLRPLDCKIYPIFAMGHDAVGVLRPSDLVAKCKSVLSFGVDVKLEGNFICGERGCVEKGVLNGNGLVGKGVPDKGGRGGFIDVKFKRELFDSLVGKRVASRNILDRALVRLVTTRNYGVREYCAGGAVDSFGSFARFDSECLTNGLDVPECSALAARCPPAEKPFMKT